MATFNTQLQAVGFSYDTLTATGYRKIDGFCFTVRIDVNAKMYTVNVSCAVPRAESAQELNAGLQQYAEQHKKSVRSAFYDGQHISICYQDRDLVMNVGNGVREAVDVCMYYIQRLGARPICRVCGQIRESDIYAMEKQVTALCPDCFLAAQRQLESKTAAESEVTENVPLGLVGALLGGLAGAVLWVLFSLLGKIVIVAGALAAMAAFFLYKKFAKRISKKGLFLSLGVGLVILLAGMYFAIGVDVFRDFQDAGYPLGFSEAFDIIPEYISWNVGVVLFNNIFGLVTYLVGSAVCMAQFFNDNKTKNRAIKLT